MTRAEEADISIMQTGTTDFSGCTSSNPELWVQDQLLGENKHRMCIEDNTSLTAFNYMVIKYKWGNRAGADWNTFTGIVNTG
jgi:hypothetical protein